MSPKARFTFALDVPLGASVTDSIKKKMEKIAQAALFCLVN